ncbi:MAG: hypothetical protein NTY45_02910 [Elusimicrobia bacterium]|nr:hypothetical protein [Elusimicrobiota bacterium]
MTVNEWKLKLRPAGLLLACYFSGPPLAHRWLDAPGAAGGSAFPDILQAALGAAILYLFFGLEAPLRGELTERLGRRGQPRERTLELTEKAASAAGYLCAAALLLPPLGGLFPHSRLLGLVKLCAVIYIAYTSCVVWKLSEPFLADVPQRGPEGPEAPPAAALGRCAKCGQQLDASMKVCAFCGQPLP